MCPVNFRIWLPFDHNNIGHNHQQNSTAPEQIYPACPVFTKIHQFTFCQPKPLIQRCLDFFLISSSLQDVRFVDILPAINSDHSAIYLRLQSISSKNKGSYHWKFNSSLLNNSEYVSQMRENIPNFVSEFSKTSESLDSRVKWEFLKYSAETC